MTSLTESPPRRNEAPADKAKALRQTIDDHVDVLAKAVDAVRASDMFKRYLNVQARFHKYSWGNTMLIYSQNPDAERVAGFGTWKKLGRHVLKGEHGIRIFAPCPWKRTDTDDAGNDTERQGMYFKVVHVFDVSQTDGTELPKVDVPDVEIAADSLLGILNVWPPSAGLPSRSPRLNPARTVSARAGASTLLPDTRPGNRPKPWRMNWRTKHCIGRSAGRSPDPLPSLKPNPWPMSSADTSDLIQTSGRPPTLQSGKATPRRCGNPWNESPQRRGTSLTTLKRLIRARRWPNGRPSRLSPGGARTTGRP